MTGRLRAYFKRSWPVGLLLLVACSLVAFKIHQSWVTMTTSEWAYACGNNLVIQTKLEMNSFAFPAGLTMNLLPVEKTVTAKLTWPVPPPTASAILIPLWPYQAALVVIALREIVTRPRNHASRTGNRCACGYNLRGNVSGICPECGNVVVLE